MKRSLAILMILALVGTGGCIFQKKTTETDEVEVTEVEVIEEVTEEASDAVVQLEESVDVYEAILESENADSSDCADIEEDIIRETCEQKFIYEEAVASGDTSNCSDLNEEADQEMCVAEISD